jgi:adenylate kinase family enzyme
VTRIVIIGNSGSGKSTLARELAGGVIPTLDLDTLYWEPGKIAERRAPGAVKSDLERFCTANESWIVEGCYGDLAQHALRFQPELIFLNPSGAVCLQHCRDRPWEPHKYASKAEQDAKLGYLLKWVSGYYVRNDDMSLKRHRALFDAYAGPKREVEK